MSHTIQALLRHLRSASDPAGEAADADLLGRFAARRDGAAFAALVARHGPMVLGVCRRLLGDPLDAEDAFQVTFLVLARKAGSLARGDPVGAWLHGVACRTAAHARADRARRRARERRATPMGAAEHTPAVLWEDLRPVLDAEVGRLPEVYRVPVVLCYLGGLTYAEAAREIGCPKGTVATRLAKARELLSGRLSGRGITLTAAGLAGVLADHARAALPAVLLQATVEAATTSVAPPAVATLTAEVLKAMAGPKLKVVTALFVAAGLLAAGAGALAYRATAGDPSPRPTIDPAAPEETRAGDPGGKDDPGWIRVRAAGRDKTLSFRPDGTGRTEAAAGPAGRLTSPDGKSVLSVVATGNDSVIHIADADGANARPISPTGVYAGSPCWSPDGRRVAFVARADGQLRVHVMDRDGRDVRQRPDGPHGAWYPRFAADGRLAYLSYRDPPGKRRRADLVIDDGKEATVAVGNTVFSDYAWSPDGTAIAYCKPGALVFHDVPSGKEQEVALAAIDARLADHSAVRICWSPDGRAVACEMIFWGGRQAGTKMFGDDLVFVIPRAGKPTWFQPGEPFLDLQWVRTTPDAAPPGPGLIRIDANARAKTVVFRPDGTGRTEVPSPVPLGQVASPDGRSIAYISPLPRDGAAGRCELFVADADGKDARRVSPAGLVSAAPCWSPDGKRVAFAGMRGGNWQVHVADRDGTNLRQVTDAPHGAEAPAFRADGRLTYLVRGKTAGEPSDLVAGDGKDAAVLVKAEVVLCYAWSPDGTAVAYGTPRSLVFLDPGTGKKQAVAMTDVDTRLTDHAPFRVCWSPDGRAAAATLGWWSDKPRNGPRVFGDEEVFVIPRTGKATWFDPGVRALRIEWVRENPAKPRPAAAEPPTAAGAWSEPAGGVRGRLILVDGPRLADGARETPVYVELENVGPAGADRAVYFDPGGLRGKLTDAGGRALPEHPLGDVLTGGPPAAWVTLPYDSSARLRASPPGYGLPDGRVIVLNTSTFLLKAGDPGEYRLSVTLTVAPPAGHGRAGAWAGKLELPPVAVRAFAARPSVADATTGITVSVKEDGRTIAARGRDGKAVWEADVIKTAGIPFVGAPTVRDLLLLKDGRVTAVFGKHSFADFDLATGKFLGAGSD